MNIKQYIEEKGISIYKLANEANVAYPTVFNMVNGKVNLMNCSLGIVKKVADALNLTVDEMITLCEKDYSFELFRGEQCHLVGRMGEVEYIIDILEKDPEKENRLLLETEYEDRIFLYARNA